MKLHSAVLSCTIGILACTATADDLEFDGHDLVEPDCDAMATWYQCRDIDRRRPVSSWATSTCT